MATALLLLRALAPRDAAARLPHLLSQSSSVLAPGWSRRATEEAAAVVARGYRTLASEVESLERSWRLTDFCLRRGLSVKSGAGQEKGKGEESVGELVAVEKDAEKVEKVRKVGRPRKVEDGVEKAKPRRKARATMKKLEEEIAANEAASGSGVVPVKLKLTTRKKRSVSVAVASADSGELAVSDSSFDDLSLGIAPRLGEEVGKLGSEEEFRSQGSSALADGESEALNSKAVGESSNAILSSLVEDGESQVEIEEVRIVFPPLKGAVQSGTRREAVDAPPRTAPRFPKLDLTSKQRITRVELEGDDKGNEKGANVVVPDQYSDPKKVFQMLQQGRPGAYTSAEKARLSWIFHRFAESGLVRPSLTSRRTVIAAVSLSALLLIILFFLDNSIMHAIRSSRGEYSCNMNGFSRDLRVLVFAGIGGTLVDFRSKRKPNGFAYLGY
jgi:hypothetical protein